MTTPGQQATIPNPAHPPNPGVFFSDIAAAFTGVRDSLAYLQAKRSYITAMGGTTYLTQPYPQGLGMDAAEATQLIAALDQHYDLSVMYTGGEQAPALNYRDNAARFWGGR